MEAAGHEHLSNSYLLQMVLCVVALVEGQAWYKETITNLLTLNMQTLVRAIVISMGVGQCLGLLCTFVCVILKHMNAT